MMDDLVEILQIEQFFGDLLLFADKECGEISDHIFLRVDSFDDKVAGGVIVDPDLNLLALVFADAFIGDFEESVNGYKLFKSLDNMNNFVFIPFLDGKHPVSVNTVNSGLSYLILNHRIDIVCIRWVL